MPRDTTDQLRSDIDSERTGDKQPGSDPAAAPLGTDDEAGGAGHSERSVATASSDEATRTPTNIGPGRQAAEARVVRHDAILKNNSDRFPRPDHGAKIGRVWTVFNRLLGVVFDLALEEPWGASPSY